MVGNVRRAGEKTTSQKPEGIVLKSALDIERMRKSGRIVADALQAVSDVIEPGLSTADINRVAEDTIVSFKGARPAFKGYRGFPSTLCVSINNEVVHGIPSDRRKLKEGDVVSMDVGVFLDGYFADAAITVPVGDVPEGVLKFIEVTERALMEGLDRARTGNRLGDISSTIQNVAEKEGYSVVRSLVGHGIGSRLHEDPQVPNFGFPGTGIELKEGLVLAIEPMFNMGGWEVRTLQDQWTVVTVDGSISAHFEHTVAITRNGPMILTRRE